MGNRSKLAFGLAAASGFVLTVAYFVLVRLNWSHPEAEAYYWRPAALAQGLVSLVFIVIGLFLVSRRPNNAVGWAVAALGIANMGYQAVTEYAVYGLLVKPGAVPLSAEAGALTQTVWAIPFAVVPLLLLIYPTGRFISRIWSIGAVLTGVMVAITVVDSLLLMQYRSLGKDLLALDEVEAALPFEFLVYVTLGLLLVNLALGIGSMMVRWRRGDRVERLQIKWLAVASSLLLVQGIWATLGGSDGGFWDASREVLLLVALVALPLAIAVAVLRYRLFEIDRIISRTVSYGLVTGLLILVYLGSVFILRRFLPVEGSLAVAVSTLATAALFSPVRRRVQALVDRRFNRARYDAEQTLASFAGRLHNQIDLTDLAGDLRKAVVETVQPSSMTFWLRSR